MENLPEWLCVILAAVCGGIGWAWLQQAREIDRMRVDLTHERASHWRTWCALGARDRQIGRLDVRIKALQEIAAASSMGAQLYQALISELRDPDAKEMPPRNPHEHGPENPADIPTAGR